MDAKELRIGNLLQTISSKKPTEVTDIWKDNVLGTEGFFCFGYKPWDVEPIALTDKWFLRFGFIKEKDEYVGMGDVFCFIKEVFGPRVRLYIHEDGIYSLYAYNDIKCAIKYVHQLQNLFYCLTGEELTLKP